MTDVAVRELLSSLESRQDSLAVALEAMESTHTAAELAEDRNYCALVSASLWLARVEENVHYWLHKSNASRRSGITPKQTGK